MKFIGTIDWCGDSTSVVRNPGGSARVFDSTSEFVQFAVETENEGRDDDNQAVNTDFRVRPSVAQGWGSSCFVITCDSVRFFTAIKID